MVTIGFLDHAWRRSVAKQQSAGGLSSHCGWAQGYGIIRGMDAKRRIPYGVINWAELVRGCFLVDYYDRGRREYLEF